MVKKKKMGEQIFPGQIASGRYHEVKGLRKIKKATEILWPFYFMVDQMPSVSTLSLQDFIVIDGKI